MGPRSDERGNVEIELIHWCEVALLQWGRAPMSAEMKACAWASLACLSGFNGAALR